MHRLLYFVSLVTLYYHRAQFCSFVLLPRKINDFEHVRKVRSFELKFLKIEKNTVQIKMVVKVLDIKCAILVGKTYVIARKKDQNQGSGIDAVWTNIIKYWLQTCTIGI